MAGPSFGGRRTACSACPSPRLPHAITHEQRGPCRARPSRTQSMPGGDSHRALVEGANRPVLPEGHRVLHSSCDSQRDREDLWCALLERDRPPRHDLPTPRFRSSHSAWRRRRHGGGERPAERQPGSGGRTLHQLRSCRPPQIERRSRSRRRDQEEDGSGAIHRRPGLRDPNLGEPACTMYTQHAISRRRNLVPFQKVAFLRCEINRGELATPPIPFTCPTALWCRATGHPQECALSF